jgi:hypothetical protein
MLEELLRAAVKDYASAVNLHNKIVPDMSQLLAVSAKLPLSHFDYWERLIRSDYALTLIEKSKPKWQFWSKAKQPVTWLDLTSRNGYTRENALRSLSGEVPNTFFFSLVLRRLNDWVPQVRLAAREKLLEMARSTNPQYVAEALCIAISNWHSWGRIAVADKAVILQVIAEKNIAALLRERLVSSAAGPMPTIFAQLGRTTILDASLKHIAVNAVQPSVRAKAYRSLFEGRIVWLEGRKWVWSDVRYCQGRLQPMLAERKLTNEIAIQDLLFTSATDKSSLVRRVSAEILIKELENLGDLTIELAQKFAEDKAPAVSERGRFALKEMAKRELVSMNNKTT